MIWPIVGAGLGFLLGAIIGSFLATLILRWPAERSVGGRSSCDHCHHQLGPADLIPLLSALATGGRCRSCGHPIEPTHWQVELAAALVGALSLAIGQGWAGPALAVMGWLLLALAWLDARHHWLPDRLVLLLAVSGLVGGEWLGVPIDQRLIGLIAGWVCLATVRRTYRHLRHREGLGGGDPKLFGAIGAWLGWVPLPLVLLLAALMGLAAAVALRRKATDRMAFGTPLCAAAWLVALARAASA